MFKNKTILITGGTGSFGQRFVKTLIKKYKFKKLIIYSRDELKQFEMQKKISSNILKKIRFFIGDVRDKERLNMAMKEVDIVIHAAALKQVPAIEYNPFEAVKTNINGANNIIEAAISNNVERVIALSTDKASSPINVYGATKLMSDKLFVAANNYSGNKKIKFSVVRYGNVFGSRGSVVSVFQENSKKNNFTITAREMTRFNITIDEGVNFTIFALKNMLGGEIFIPKLKSYNILDLVKAFSINPKIKVIGVRPGEKIHEEMISIFDASRTIELKNFFIILPDFNYKNYTLNFLLSKYKKQRPKFCKFGFSYNSFNNKYFLTVNDLKKLISENK
jgi:UDP-N-acetylglucosamine 4,6-dehydratase